jgi:DNA-binding NarL/FixJ family response regulator
LIVDSLAALLADVEELQVVGHASSMEELVEKVDESTPDAVLLFVRSPVTTQPTIEAARQLRREHPELGVLIISDRGNGLALELLRGGASRVAYLLDENVPNIQSVVATLHELRAGQTVLTPSIVDGLVRGRGGVMIEDVSAREVDVLEQLAKGLSNRGIAETLHVSVKTVEKHVSSIFRKLGLEEATAIDRRVTAAQVYLRAKTHAAAPTLPATRDGSSH